MLPLRRTLGRRDRLATADAFSRVFDHNDFRASHRHALILASQNSDPQSRLGMVISKKQVRRAVDRHRLKRLIREHFRLNREVFAGLDIVVLARGGLDGLSNRDVVALMQQLGGNLRKKAPRSGAQP